MKLVLVVQLAWLILLCAADVAGQGIGASKTEAEVRAVVTTWVRSVTADARPDATIERVEPFTIDGSIAAYIVHLSGGGFCLCGASEKVLPVYFYSPEGVFDPENPEFRFILEDIGARDNSIRKAQSEGNPLIAKFQPALSHRAALWRDLAAGITASAKPSLEKTLADPATMEIPMTSQWRQGSPYNDNCPILTPGSDEHAVVGCVATAMAQIMRYWGWPQTGIAANYVYYYFRHRSDWDAQALATDPKIPAGWAGGNRLQWVTPQGSGQLQMSGYWDASLYNNAKGISQDAGYRTALAALWNRLPKDSTQYYVNFGASTYDWSALHDVHTDPVDDGDGELAKINYHAGVAVNSYYGVSATGSNTEPLRNGFVYYMRYDGDAWFCPMNESFIVEEITWLRPVAFGGSSLTEGHEWVVFGYNMLTSPWEFKMNFGWGPGSTGWYIMDSCGFTIGRDQIMRIAPMGVVRFVGGNAEFPNGRPGTPYRGIEEALSGAPEATTLIFKAGAEYTFSATELVINRPLVLKGKDVLIRKF